MRFTPLPICLLFLAGCGDEEGDSAASKSAEVTVFELRPAQMMEREGWEPMRDVSQGGRMAFFVAKEPTVGLSDFVTAEVRTFEGRRLRLVTAQLSDAATRKIVSNCRANSRLTYAIIVNDQLYGTVQVGPRFDGAVQLRAGRKLAEGIVAAVRRE